MAGLEDLSSSLLPSSWSLLHVASYQDDTERLRSLVAKYPDKIDSLDSAGRSPLQIAFESQHAASMAVLIGSGASLDTLSYDNAKGSEVFDHFIQLGSQVFFALSSTNNIFQPSQYFMHVVLCDLVMAASDEITEQLEEQLHIILSKLTNINKHDNVGLTPLHYAAIKGDTSRARILLDHSAKVGVYSKTDLATPIHYACRHGNIEMVDLLLKESPDPNELLLRQDIKGCTPTHWALYNKHWDLLVPLLTSYQDLFESSTNIVDNEGYTVRGLLFYARLKSLPSSYQSCMPCLSVEEATWLLHSGVSDKDEEVVIHAIDQGAELDVFDFSHQTPLLLAAKLGSTGICNLLLRNRKPPDVNRSDWTGRTPLHYASRNNHVSTVRCLLEEENIDLYSTSSDGCTPLEVALEMGSLDAVKVLLDACRVVGVDGFHGDWMRLLSLAAGTVDDVSIIRDIVELFCPVDWPKIITDPSSVSSSPSSLSFTRKSVSILKVFNPLSPLPKLFRRDILRPSKARTKFRQHSEELSNSKQNEFVNHSFVKSKRAATNKRLQAKFKSNSFQCKKASLYRESPLHVSLYSHSKYCFFYLIKEVKRAGCFSKFLSLKSSNGVTGGVLLAEKIDEGSISIDSSMEQELFEHLMINEYNLCEDVPFGWAILHYLIIALTADNSKLQRMSKFIQAPLKNCPHWIIRKYVTQNYCQISNDDFTDIVQISRVAAAILEKEHYNVLEAKKPHPSLVFASVFRKVDIRFLKVLLKKGDTTIVTGRGLQFTMKWQHDTIQFLTSRYGNYISQYYDDTMILLHPRFDITEALIMGHVDHAKIILESVELSTYFSSVIDSSSLIIRPNDVVHSINVPIGPKGSTCFYSELIRGIHHLVAADAQFEFVVELLQLFPENELERYLLLDNRSIRILLILLLSINGASLGCYLLDAYLHYIASIIRGHALNGESNKVDNCRFLALLKQFLQVIELFPSCLWTCESFDLFKNLVTFCYHELTYVDRVSLLLHKVCGDGMEDLVRLIFAGQGKDYVLFKDDKGRTPIYFAAYGGHVEVVEILLSEGVSLDDLSIFGESDPFLGVLYYLKSAPFYHQHSKYKSFNYSTHPVCRFSKAFEDISQAKKLVNLVKPSTEKLERLDCSLSVYVRALTSLCDFRPLSDFMTEFSLNALISKTDIESFDGIIRRTCHFDYHPSPHLCSFLFKVISSFMLVDPLIAANKSYWEVVIAGLPYCHGGALWVDVFSVALRKKKKDVALSILQRVVQEGDEVAFPDYIKIACSFRQTCALLEVILKVSLSDEAICDGLKAAASKGNFEEFKMVANHRPSVLKGRIVTQILRLSAKKGHEDIVKFLYSYKDEVTSKGLENGTSSTFWTTVLESAALHGRSHLSLVAVGNLSYSETVSLSSWEGYMNLINSCCWWGLVDILDALTIEDHSVYLATVHNVTPFESGCGNGNFGKLSDVAGFPTIADLVRSNFPSIQLYPSACIVDIVSRGWWTEGMSLSGYDSQHVFRNDSLNHCSRCNFLAAVSCNLVVFVKAFLNKWGTQAGAVMEFISQDLNVIDFAINSRNPSILEMILKSLYDSGITIFPGPKAVSTALMQRNPNMIKCLSRFINLAAISIEVDGYNILHLLGLYCQSDEVYDLVVSLIQDSCPSLLLKKDCMGYIPLQCALSMGNYSTAAKYFSLMKRNNLVIDVDISNQAKYARGWFRKLMSVNETVVSTEDCPIITTRPNIRDSKAIVTFYEDIKNTDTRAADILLEASLGSFSFNSSLTKHSIDTEGGIFISSLPLLQLDQLSKLCSSGGPFEWIWSGQDEQLVDVLQYTTVYGITNPAADDFNELFDIACSCAAVNIVQYLLKSTLAIDSFGTVTGFKTAFVLGHLEIAAYILLNANLPFEEFQSEVIEFKVSDIVQLIFFGKPEEIADALCSPSDIFSRVSFAQIWMLHQWGQYQIKLLDNRLNSIQKLIENWKYELSTDVDKTVCLHIDTKSFNCICSDDNCQPLYPFVATIASCLTHLYPLSHSPPTHSLSSLFANSSVPEYVTLSCALHPSTPVATSDGYRGNVSVSYNPQANVFYWPQTISNETVPVLVSTDSFCMSIVPMEMIQDIISCIIKFSNLDFPVTVSLDDIEDYIRMTSSNHDVLFCVIEQSIRDVLSVLKLINIPAGIYSNVLPKGYSQRFNSLFVLTLAVTGVNIDFGISMSSGIVTGVTDDGQIHISIHLELDEDSFTAPLSSELQSSISNELLTVELPYLQGRLNSYISQVVNDCPSLSSMEIFFDGMSLSTCSFESVYFFKLHPLIERFLHYFSDALSLVESYHQLFAQALTSNFKIYVVNSSEIEMTDTSLKLGVANLQKHNMHRAIRHILQYFVAQINGFKESISDDIVPSTSYFPIDTNYKFLISSSDQCVVDLCNISSDVIETVSLDYTSDKASFNIRKLPITNSPLRRKGNDVPSNNYTIKGDIPVISLPIDDSITCIVSHPNGGCTGTTPRVILPHYTSVRQQLAPRKGYRKDNLMSAVFKGHPIHYISCIRDSKGNKFTMSAAASGKVNPFHILSLTSSDFDKQGKLQVVHCHVIGSGIYRVTLKCTAPKSCQVISVCSRCQCLMRLHWSHGSSILPQKLLFLPGNIDPKVSFVASQKTSTQRSNIKPLKAGTKLQLYLFARDKSNHVIQCETPPSIFLQFNNTYFPCLVKHLEEQRGVYLIEHSCLTIKGRYNIVIKQDSAYLLIDSFDLHSDVPFPDNCIIDLPVIDGQKTLSTPSNFSVLLYDRYNNVCDATKYVSSFHATLISQESRRPQRNCECKANQTNPGAIDVSINFLARAIYSGVIKILFNHVQIPGSPVAIVFDFSQISFNEKHLILMRVLRLLHSRGYTPTLTIDRSNILESAVQALAPSSYFSKTIRVRFNDEPGIDDGGLSKEFFHLLSQELVNPLYALFKQTSTGLYKPNPFSSVNPTHLFYFEFCGKVLAKAIYESCALDVRFTPAVYKFLLSKPTTIEDLREEDISLYNGLQNVLECTTEDELQSISAYHTAELEKFGSLVSVEIVHGGKEKEVTLDNKQEYIDSLAHFYMTGCIKEQLMALCKGFMSLSDKFIKNFTSKELEYMISGERKISLDKLKSKVYYQWYTSTSNQIQWLWSILESFNQEELSKFIQFVTGSPLIPVDTKWRMTISRSNDSSHLPTASTCSANLCLPLYSSKEELETKLKLALHQGGGFYLS